MTEEQENRIIDAINNQNIKCENNYKINTLKANNTEEGFLKQDGTIDDGYNAALFWHNSDFIKVDQNSDYKIHNASGQNPSYCLYNNNDQLINCTRYAGQSTVSINTGNASYIKYSGLKQYDVYLTKDTYCYNIIEKQNEKIDSIIGGIIFIIGILLVISLLTRRLKY